MDVRNRPPIQLKVLLLTKINHSVNKIQLININAVFSLFYNTAHLCNERDDRRELVQRRGEVNVPPSQAAGREQVEDGVHARVGRRARQRQAPPRVLLDGQVLPAAQKHVAWKQRMF